MDCLMLELNQKREWIMLMSDINFRKEHMCVSEIKSAQENDASWC